MQLRQRRFYSPHPAFARAKLEPIHQPLYSAGAIDNAALPRELLLFNYAVGGTVSGAGGGAVAANQWHTNLPSPNGLPMPKLFLVTGIRVIWSQMDAIGTSLLDPSYTQAAENTDSEDDFLAAWYGGFLRFFVGTKDYLVAPLFLTPGNTGIDGYAALAATAVNIANFARIDKAHSVGRYFALDKYPVLIPSQQNFFVSLNWPQATPATMIDEHLVWCVFDGIYGREV